MKLTLIQTDIAWNSQHANIARAASLIAGTVETDIIILPEVFNSGFLPANTEECTSHAHETVSWLRTNAKKRGFAICTSIFETEGDKTHNRLYFVKPDGSVVTYDKRHLFIGDEGNYISRGNKRTTCEYKGWRILFLVCYDLRFPVWSRNRDDYDLIIIVANWPEPRRDVWKTLLRARAIENQCYVAGVNRVGTDPNGVSFAGESMVIDPYGRDILALDPFRETTGTAEISLDQLTRFRESFPAWRDRDEFTIL
ncbi:MAG: amidohydrolase [Bacteroidales bacterium]|nr:amidohydrolase [Bacteroidales bacterium]